MWVSLLSRAAQGSAPELTFASRRTKSKRGHRGRDQDGQSRSKNERGIIAGGSPGPSLWWSSLPSAASARDPYSRGPRVGAKLHFGGGPRRRRWGCLVRLPKVSSISPRVSSHSAIRQLLTRDSVRSVNDSQERIDLLPPQSGAARSPCGPSGPRRPTWVKPDGT